MKTLRLLGSVLLTILFAINFTSCKEDENPVDLNLLEGTWMLTHSKGWDMYNGDKVEWDDEFDPYHLDSDSQRIIIRKLSENRFSVAYGEYSGTQWYETTSTVTVEGNNIIDDEVFPGVQTLIENLSADRLVIRETYIFEEDGDTESGDITNTYIKF